jgi:hypothetical protein
MNCKGDFKINEFDKLIINEKKLIQNKGQKQNLFLIIILIIIKYSKDYKKYIIT